MDEFFVKKAIVDPAGPWYVSDGDLPRFTVCSFGNGKWYAIDQHSEKTIAIASTRKQADNAVRELLDEEAKKWESSSVTSAVHPNPQNTSTSQDRSH